MTDAGIPRPRFAARTAGLASGLALAVRPAGLAETSLWTGLTLPSRIAIGAALEASIDLGHNYLGCEHLLLGLLDDPSSGAGQVLHSVGIDKAGIRRAITSAAAGFAQAAQDTTGADIVKLDELIQRLEAIEHRLTAAHL